MSKNKFIKTKLVAVESIGRTTPEIDLSLVGKQYAIPSSAMEDSPLNELLKGVTKDNIHSEEDTNIRVGNEIW